MQVMITRPVEETMSGIPGMQSVRSITSRGSAEVVFFDWNVDMILTLQLCQAAIARVQPSFAVDRENRQPTGSRSRALPDSRLQS